MSDLARALSDLQEIRARLAAGSQFHGLGPGVIAASGCLALGFGALQSWVPALRGSDTDILIGWVVVAVLSCALIGSAAIGRARRRHGSLANAMIVQAIERFLPAGLAGAALGAVLLMAAPQALWILPGLWAVLSALGVFAAAPSLPPNMRLVGAWYLLCGIAVLALAAETRTVTSWSMAVPFGLGQLLAAGLLQHAQRGTPHG
ncbi:MAG: hypothetical protein AAGC92_07670 [Pseudomonadota bacterium]